jgi:aryl-alcohol dehydrogenase-like predicted oxidoreductase
MAMQLRRMGRTGLKVFPLCLGGNVFGWTADEAASFAVLDAYAAGGGNFIDTANIYANWVPGHSGGESESVLGRWMQARGNRDQIVLATKVGGDMGPGPNDGGLSRRHIMAAVDASLRRLQTDYIDLYQAHFDDGETPLDETMAAFDDLVRQGKVRYLGASNYRPWRLTKSLWESDRRGLARFDCLQPEYNLMSRAGFEADLEPLCLDQGLGVIPYYSLAAGFLTGKYRPNQPLPASPRARQIQQRYMNERGFAVLRSLDEVGLRHGATPAQVALAWLMARPGVTAPIASATTTAQVNDLLQATALTLTPEDVATLDRASAWESP